MTASSRSPAPLVLGTAQLGMAYGIANRAGMPGPEAASALVHHALSLGVTCFDTARAYGESEARLGRALWGHGDARVFTKLSPLNELDENAPAELVAEAVSKSVSASADALCRGRLDGLMLHRARHLHAWGGVVWQTLKRLCADHRIRALGVSVQNTDELRLALSFRDVRHIQMPLNVLDWRWRDPALFARFALRPDVTIHVRSALLQGLLASPVSQIWPPIPGLDTMRLLDALTALSETLGRAGLADLCFAYVRGKPFVDGIVVGVDTMAQLDANAALFARPALDADECAFVERFLPRLPEKLLNPAQWPTRKAA